MWPKFRENPPFAILLMVLIFLGALFLAVKTYEVATTAGKPVPYEHQITVEGLGRVTGKPDIASISFGIESRAPELAAAQDKNTQAMNALIVKIKALGITEDDIQTTNYNAYQNYEWNPDKQRSDPADWIVSQFVTVKVRNTELTSQVIQAAGQNGATNISGPNFVIDDPENLKAQARAEALANAKVKAQELSAALGVKLEEIVSYSEWSTDNTVPVMYRAEGAYGMGGGGGPDLQAGTNEISMSVSLTYKLVQ